MENTTAKIVKKETNEERIPHKCACGCGTGIPEEQHFVNKDHQDKYWHEGKYAEERKKNGEPRHKVRVNSELGVDEGIKEIQRRLLEKAGRGKQGNLI